MPSGGCIVQFNFFTHAFFVLLTCVLFILLSGCAPDKKLTVISFKPYYEDTALTCNTAFTRENIAWQVEQFQFFISNVEYKSTKGKWLKWPMLTNARQAKDVALIGGYFVEGCAEQMQVENWQLSLQAIEQEDISKIRFTLGVPFQLNHLNPLKQPSPLNDSSMFWVWQTGHKFMRLELNSENNHWLFHLGSTGCKSASALRAPQERCQQANTTVIELDIDVTAPAIKVDLARLLNNVTLSDSTSCQSAHQDKYCQALFSNLGINNNQQVFRRYQ